MNDLLYAVSRCSPVYALLFGIWPCCFLPLKRDRLALPILLIQEGAPHASALKTLRRGACELRGGRAVPRKLFPEKTGLSAAKKRLKIHRHSREFSATKKEGRFHVQKIVKAAFLLSRKDVSP